jgi:hypothetical protein
MSSTCKNDDLTEYFQAEQTARHAEVNALIAAAQAERATREDPISAAEWAGRQYETGAVHHGT